VLDALRAGKPAIVMADMFGLQYNNMDFDEGWWGTLPILVYSYDVDADRVGISDRARVTLYATTEELAAARGRTSKHKNQVLTLGAPDFSKLEAAVEQGLRDAVALYFEDPPKGSRDRFGLRAFDTLADALVATKGDKSWDKVFPVGAALYNGLTTSFDRIATMHVERIAGSREVYGDFLDEAAAILNKPALRETGKLFRATVPAWTKLATALLPDTVPLLKESRELRQRDHELFLTQGNDSLAERKQIKARLKAIRNECSKSFPLDTAGVKALKESIRDAVLKVKDAETKAAESLRENI
jgi:hypothetical protein